MLDQSAALRSVAGTTSSEGRRKSCGSARDRAAGGSDPKQTARRSGEISPMVAVIPELTRETMEGLYAIRLAAQWLETRIDSDSEARMAIALIRQSESHLRGLIDRTRAEALKMLDPR